MTVAQSAEPDPAFLGVERSIGGRFWSLRPVDERLVRGLAQRHGLPDMVARVLGARGVAIEDAPAYLAPSLRAAMPDPHVLLDMAAAADRLAAAVRAGERIAVFGDYDVDGATSTALLIRYLRAVGAPPLAHIPDRRREGYGPNVPALERLAREGAAVVVTVDCGTTAFGPLDAAAGLGLDVIVLDHHAAEPRLPRARAVVNPNRMDQTPGLGQLAACGVTFLALVALNRALREAGHFAQRAEPDLIALLDLVALGTVCDVVPLTGLNRAFVTQGLKVMARRANPGLRALADAAGVAERIDAWHLGFLIGPRINAAGRIGQADAGARLLSTEDPGEAAALAARLDTDNTDRKAIEAEVLADATARLDAAGDSRAVLLAAGEGWHPGVVGLVAGRLRERYNRPVCIVAMDGGIGTGSGRSIPQVDLGAAVVEARRAGLLMSGGGHRMAAGFTVAEDRLGDLEAFLEGHVADRLDGPPVATLALDGALAPGGAGVELAAALERLGPYGAGNPEPMIALRDVRVARSDVVGENHVRCFLTGPDGGRLSAIAFRCAEEPLGRVLLERSGVPLHLAGVLRVNRWQGREDPQFRIEDAAPAWGGAGGPAA
ncbi:MAG: single-stranded-DNA-specific exonuclease RecJ [Azospirillaceae bacterium]